MPSFLSPLFLAGSLTAALPIVLHLLRREPEPRIRFAAVRLLRGAPVELTHRRRLREVVLLVLRVAALGLLAVAFARPFFPAAGALSAGATIVAVDTSYSMSVPGRFARAQALAKQAVRQATAGDPVGVITFADAADLVSPVEADRAPALGAIDAAAPGFGATRYRAALGAAVQALGGTAGRIVMVTDLQENGWDDAGRTSVPESLRVEVLDVGAVAANLAVTDLRRSDDDRVMASILNGGDAARETRAHLVLDGAPAADAVVSIGPHATAVVDLGAAANASEAIVTIEDPGGIAADDTRYAMVGEGRRPAVLAVTSTGDLARDAFYFKQALAGGSRYRIAATSPGRIGAQGSEPLSAYAAVVLLSTSGLERRGREALAAYVAGGGGLLLAVGPDVDGDVVADVLGADAPLGVSTAGADFRSPRSLVPLDDRHPVFQAFGAALPTLGLVSFRRVARIESGGCQTIARMTSGEAALLSCDVGQGRATILASDLDNRWNDFPLHATFVPFVFEMLRYLTGTRLSSSQLLVSGVPNGVAPTPGFATIATHNAPASSGRRVAVNVDPRESDLTRMPEEEFQESVARLKEAGALETRRVVARQEDRQHLWMFAVGLVLAVLTIESLVAGGVV
jgi:hypothetical protein